jgi:hypothetical protein
MALPPALYAAPPGDSMVAQADGLTVHDAWARASAGAATTGAAYVMVMGGSQPDQLIGASSPVAATAEVHQTLTENGVMKMRPAPNLPIPAGQMVTFAPGGTHIMLMGLKHPLAAGQTFPLTLTFAHAGPITVDVAVRGVGHGANSGMGGHDAMPMR